MCCLCGAEVHLCRVCCVLLLLLLLQVYLHPSSVLHDLTAGQLQQPHVVYLEKTKTTRVSASLLHLRGCPAALLLCTSQVVVEQWQVALALCGCCRSERLLSAHH